MAGSYKLKDLSRMLNMSPSTVSKALNDYPTISQMTRDRVKELARRVNYTPDPTAISFKRKKSFSIGVIIPNLLDHFYTIAVGGIEESAMANGYKAIVTQHYEDVGREVEIAEMMARNRVDGLIVSISRETTDILHFRQLEAEGIPVVYFVRRPGEDDVFHVTSNVYKGTSDAVDFLYERGHRRIGQILGPASLQATRDRQQGYMQALQAHGLPWDDSLLVHSNLSEESTVRAVEHLATLHEPPTAVIAFKDQQALDAMLHLKRNRRGDPPMEFVGFGNLPLLKYLDNPPLATLEEQCATIGSRAAEMLMTRISEPDARPDTRSVSFDCRLLVLK
jgi:DNA-binding LacI/PurR family transcriptional regulator